MPTPFSYKHSGLRIASQIELPEWREFAGDGEGPNDVEIVVSDEPSPDCSADMPVVEDAALRFSVPGIGGWQVEGGHTIRLHPGMAADLPELRLFTLGSAWGALGYQRGFAMWHGSAVARDGRAILFCGDTGAGKSTMAAAMVARGARLVADDLSRVEPSGDSAQIHPSSTRIKLWREAIDLFGWQEAVLQRDYFREDKFHCAVPRHCAGDAPLRLSAIVSLEDADELSLTRLSGSDALERAMRQAMYRPEMLDALGKWGEQGALGAAIVAGCPVYALRRQKDFAALDEVCAQIESLWSE